MRDPAALLSRRILQILSILEPRGGWASIAQSTPDRWRYRRRKAALRPGDADDKGLIERVFTHRQPDWLRVVEHLRSLGVDVVYGEMGSRAWVLAIYPEVGKGRYYAR